MMLGPHWNLGLVLLEQGRLEEVLRQLRAALELDPSRSRRKNFQKVVLPHTSTTYIRQETTCPQTKVSPIPPGPFRPLT